jgi:hypothetical protein
MPKQKQQKKQAPGGRSTSSRVSQSKLPLLTDSMCRKALKDLRGFGYENLQLEEVKEAARQISLGTDSNTNVIAVILRQQIEQAVEDTRGR